MRERRWESRGKLTFREVLALGDRLALLGLNPATAKKEIISYIEEWTVPFVHDFSRLDPWTTEDVTLVHIAEKWHGDFFLLTGGYHTVYLNHQATGTYCSVSHPWKIRRELATHYPGGMFWVGFRQAHAFVRVRLHTIEVVPPGETREDARRALWLEERRHAFAEAIEVLNLPIESREEHDRLVLSTPERNVPFFCSWPDTFGPCQFEYNSSDVFEFLVPSGRLAATWADEPVTVRAYLTGFSQSALEEFHAVLPGARQAYRCSAHCSLEEIPDVLAAVAPSGRLYAPLCEFQSLTLLPNAEEAWGIVGIVGEQGRFQIEVRLNRAPLPEDELPEWLETLLGVPVVYAPLSPFP